MRKTDAIAPIPDAQIKPGFSPFQPRHLERELGRVRVSVPGVDETRGLPVAERVHVVEIGRAKDDAQVD